MDIDLTPRLRAKMTSRPRVRGRYNSSELYAILYGFGKKKRMMDPHEWMHPEPRQVKDMLNMWNGTMTHEHVQKLLKSELCEIKKEIKYKDITLVAKADYLPDHVDEVWEFKTSEKLMDHMKPWQEHQAQVYTTAFERSRTVVYQPLQSDTHGIFLKDIGSVERDDEWFRAELEKLYQFHLTVEPLWQTKMP